MIKYDFTELNDIPFSSVVEKLDSIKRKGSTQTTTCPWHDDRHPSLVIYDGTKGNRCKCFACGKSGSVIDYVMAKRNVSMHDACDWLSSAFGKGVEEVESKDRKSCRKRKAHKTVKEILSEESEKRERKNRESDETNDKYAFFDSESYERCISADNSFCKCLRQVFDDETVRRATDIYCLGIYNGLGNQDDVMFPSVDAEGLVRNIKVQHYDTNPASPTFFHCDKKHIFWLGEIMRKKGEFPADACFNNSVLFGEHLLPLFPNMNVMLVESPKNAVVGWCAFQNFLWIAAGNKNNLTYQNLQCLRGRKVIVIPDRDALDEWSQRLSQLRDITPFHISSFSTTHLQECGEKGDIADWIIGRRRSERGV